MLVHSGSLKLSICQDLTNYPLRQTTQRQENISNALPPKGFAKLHWLTMAAISKNCIAAIISAILNFGTILKADGPFGNGK